MIARRLFPACVLVAVACEPRAEPVACEETAGSPGDAIAFERLQCWTRTGEPVLRDPIPGANYEVASDGHVFHDGDGTLRMIYTGDTDGHPSIKLATGTDWDRWTVTGALLAGVGPSGLDQHRETSFYRLAEDGRHQIYSIGYPDESTYQSQIFLAEADVLEGPYTMQATPLVARGAQAGRDVYLMTSPSVVEHEGLLHLVYLAWNDAPDAVSAVWVMGATSTDGGRNWSETREVEVPIGMEGQLTRGPDGKFYATATSSVGDTEGIVLSRADAPFGPYETLSAPVLVKQGAPYEVDEVIAAQISFDEASRTAYLYYAGADYDTGWWMMLASTRY